MGDIPVVFTYLGLLVFLTRLRGLVDYFWFYFFRPATDQKFLHGASPYAVVTGSSDGIGKSLAKILYAKGFNLILHGRNEEKVKNVVEEIQALYGRKDGEIKYFIANASESGHDFEGIAKRYEDLNVTLFINNVGGSGLTLKTYVTCSPPHSHSYSHQQYRIDQVPENDSRKIINLNLDFPLFLTRAFLPQLRRVSQSTGPVEIAFVGSFACELSLPFLGVYGGSKCFLKRAACTLHEEERVLHGSNLSFMYLNVGEVRSSTLVGEPSFFKPPADEFAKSVVGSLGCGRRVVVPWYSHGIVIGILGLLPESLFELVARRRLRGIAKDVKRSEER